MHAAIAKRRSRLEQTGESRIVEDIEARLNKNRKLQATKYFAGDTLKRTSQGAGGDKPDSKTDIQTSVSDTKVSPVEVTPASEVKANKTPVKVTSAKAPIEVKSSTIKVNTSVPAKVEVSKSSVEVTPSVKLNSKAPVEVKVNKTPVEVMVAKAPVELAVSDGSRVNKAISSPMVKPKEIMTHKAASSKAAPPPPPPASKSPAKSLAPKSPVATKTATAPLQSKDSGTPQKVTLTTPATLSPTNKSGAKTTPLPKGGTVKSNDFLALAEKARQDYLAKVGGGQKVTSSSTSKLNGSSGNAKEETMKKSKSAVEVVGVTQDHSHTEPSLSNGTLKHRPVNGTDFPETQLEIIPPPPSFAEEDGGTNGPAFGVDDAASYVSSVSSLSTLSSEHGHHHYDDMIVPPPPPAQFGDESAVIPPPPMFNADVKKGGWKDKSVSAWGAQDVGDWLDSLEMGQYKAAFLASGIDGPRLAGLARGDYIDLGVTQVGHRMDLQRSIKRMTLNQASS